MKIFYSLLFFLAISLSSCGQNMEYEFPEYGGDGKPEWKKLRYFS